MADNPVGNVGKNVKEGMVHVARTAAGAPKKLTVGYWHGLRYPFRGLKFVFVEHGHLVRYWIVPILLTFVSLLTLCGLTWGFYGDVTDWIVQTPQGSEWYVSILAGLHHVLAFLIGCTMLVAGTFVVMGLTSIFAAPFNAALSEEVEHIVNGTESKPFDLSHELKDVLRTIAIELVKFTFYLVVMGLTSLLSMLIPVVGQVLQFLFGIFFTTLYLAIDYLDWPAGRRGKGIAHRFGLVRHHFLAAFGFGSGAWIFLCVPFINLIFMPAAVAGGTLLYLDLEREARNTAESPSNLNPNSPP